MGTDNLRIRTDVGRSAARLLGLDGAIERPDALLPYALRISIYYDLILPSSTYEQGHVHQFFFFF